MAQRKQRGEKIAQDHKQEEQDIRKEQKQLASDFNKTADTLLDQLPKTLPEFEDQITKKKFELSGAAWIDPFAGLQGFANVSSKYKEDGKLQVENLILAEGPNVFGADVRTTWEQLSSKSQKSLIQWIEKLQRFADHYQVNEKRLDALKVGEHRVKDAMVESMFREVRPMLDRAMEPPRS